MFEGAVYRNIAVFGRKSSSEGKRKELMKIFGEKVQMWKKNLYFFLKSLNMQGGKTGKLTRQMLGNKQGI